MRDVLIGSIVFIGSGPCATATAFSAARRRLSATIQNQQARGWLESAAIAPTLKPLCPAMPTLDGGSSGRTSMPSPASAFAMRFRPRIFFELHPHRKAVAVKHRRLNQAQGRHGNAGPASQQRRQVPLHALLDAFQRLQRFLAVARQQIEGELRVEHSVFSF